MKAIFLEKTGKPEVLQITETPDPAPGRGEVRVRLSFTGLNYAEILSRKGLYTWAPKRPYILGMEGYGVIDAVGEEVDSARVGEAVILGTQFGCYAEKVVAPQERALPAPGILTPEESAAFVVNYMTAWVALFALGRLAKNEKVLITAAAGGVGTAAVQLASQFGCEVYGMAGSDEKLELIKSLGAADAFNYRHDDAFAKLQAKSGGGDFVLELVGGSVYRESQAQLNPFGRMVVAGFSSFNLQKWNPISWWKTWRAAPKANLLKMSMNSTGVMATHIGYLLKAPERMRALYDELSAFITQHNIKPVVGKVFPFEQAAQAHAFIESRRSIGKVLLSHEGN